MKYVLIALLTALVSTLIELLSRKAKPKNLTEREGRISPSRIFMWFTLIFALLMIWICAEIFTSKEKEGVFWVLLLGTLCLNFIYASLLGLFNIHDVTWNETCLVGPSSLIGIVLGWKREKIQWEEIEIYGSNWAEYIYVKGRKKKIYWGVWYPGFGKLEAIINRRTQKT